MDFRQYIFQYRSYLPFPFLVVMVIFANPTLYSLIVGFVLVVLGESIRLWGVSYAGSETRTTGTIGATYLITKGPYAYVRNPLYLGNMIIYIGFGVISQALFPWLTIAATIYFFVQYSLIVSLEEKVLSARFQGTYRRYINSVPRFLPKIKKYTEHSPLQPNIDLKRGLKSEKRTLQAIFLLTTLMMIFIIWL